MEGNIPPWSSRCSRYKSTLTSSSLTFGDTRYIATGHGFATTRTGIYFRILFSRLDGPSICLGLIIVTLMVDAVSHLGYGDVIVHCTVLVLSILFCHHDWDFPRSLKVSHYTSTLYNYPTNFFSRFIRRAYPPHVCAFFLYFESHLHLDL